MVGIRILLSITIKVLAHRVCQKNLLNLIIWWLLLTLFPICFNTDAWIIYMCYFFCKSINELRQGAFCMQIDECRAISFDYVSCNF